MSDHDDYGNNNAQEHSDVHSSWDMELLALSCVLVVALFCYGFYRGQKDHDAMHKHSENPIETPKTP